MKPLLTIPIALLVAALLGYLLLRGQETEASRHEGESTTTAPTGSTRSPLSPTGHPAKLPRPTKSSRPDVAASHAPEQLKDFIIPELALRETYLEGALFMLFDAYAEICGNTGEGPVGFTYELTGAPRQGVNLHLRQISFLAALRLIAMQSGMTMSRDGTALTFSPIAEDSGDQKIHASRPVPPNLANRLENMLDPSGSRDDPFAPPPTSNELPDMLRQLGVIQSDDTKVIYAAKSSVLVIDGNPDDFSRLQSLLEDLITPQTAIKTRIKFVDSQEPLNLPTGPIDDARYQELMRESAQRKGTHITTQPSVTSLPGQRATIEIGRELVIPDETNPEILRSHWLGTRIEVNSGGYGFGVREMGSIFSQERLDNDPAKDLISSATDYDGIHFDGQTMIVETTTPQGTPRYAFITSDLIDPAGVPVDSASPIPSPVFPSSSGDDPFAVQTRPLRGNRGDSPTNSGPPS